MAAGVEHHNQQRSYTEGVYPDEGIPFKNPLWGDDVVFLDQQQQNQNHHNEEDERRMTEPADIKFEMNVTCDLSESDKYLPGYDEYLPAKGNCS